MDFTLLSIITCLLLILSFFKDREKTLKALKIAAKRGVKITAPIFLMVLFISMILHFLPQQTISEYLRHGNKYAAVLIAGFFGSISLMPGFIAFPLGGILRQHHVPFMVIASFTSTLMMVGIVTIPVERQYLGFKISIVRNVIALAISFVVAVVTGMVYGEIV